MKKLFLLVFLSITTYSILHCASATDRTLPRLAEVDINKIHNLTDEALKTFSEEFKENKKQFYSQSEYLREKNWKTFNKKNLAQIIYGHFLRNKEFKELFIAEILSFCIAHIIKSSLPVYEYGCDSAFRCCYCMPSSYRVLQALILTLQAAHSKNENKFEYVSLGSGDLLQDYINLGALKIANVPVSKIHLIDPQYEFEETATSAEKHAKMLDEQWPSPYSTDDEAKNLIFSNQIKESLYKDIQLYRRTERFKKLIGKNIQVHVWRNVDKFLRSQKSDDIPYLAVLSDPPDNDGEVLQEFAKLTEAINPLVVNILNKNHRAKTVTISTDGVNDTYRFSTDKLKTEQ